MTNPSQPRPPNALRDWYAGLALAGCESTLEREDAAGKFWYSPDQISKRCYSIADAMLRERAK